MLSRFNCTVVLVNLLCITPVAVAQVVLNPVDQGWYDQTGFHNPSNTNIVVGFGATSNREFRNWFVFDVPSGTLPVASAVLRLYNPNPTPTSGYGYSSVDTTEKYQLSDVITPITQLTAGGSGLNSIFTDLGTGADFGSRVFSAADNGMYADVSLSAAAVSLINAANGGQFAIGGFISTISGSGDQLVFAFTNESLPPLLVINSVPEPSSLALGTLALTIACRRMRPGIGRRADGYYRL